MSSYSYPDQPVLTLLGIAGTSSGVDRYGVSDSTGLGPNGSNIYKTYRVTVSTIGSQIVGDAGVRDSLGLNVGGVYNGIDVNVGDFVTNDFGTLTFQIVQIIEKTETTIDFIYEDV